MKAKNAFFLSVGVVLLVASFVATGILYFKLKKVSEKQIVAEQIENVQEAPTTEAPIAPTSPNDFPENFEVQNLTSSLSKEKIVVDWFKGAVPATEEELQKMVYSHDQWMKEINDRKENNCLEAVPAKQPQNRPPCPVYLYKAGIIKSPVLLKDQTLYLMLFGMGEMGFNYYDFYGIYDTETTKLTVILEDDNSVEMMTNSFYKLGRFVSGYIKEPSMFLNYPQVIELVGQKSLLSWNSAFTIGSLFQGPGTNLNQGGILDVAKGEITKTYNPEDKIIESKNSTPIYLIDDNFQIQLADGAVHLYNLIPYFFQTEELRAAKEYYPNSFTANIVWTNANDKKDKYELGGDLHMGCGIKINTLTNIVNKKDWFFEKNLVEIGQTKTGEKIYELSDKDTNVFYKEFFDFGYDGSQLLSNGGEYSIEAEEKLKQISEKEKYTDFVSDTPIFFWKDSWDNWRVYIKSKFKPMAECGKPVIYLYPEKDTDVKVEVKPNGGFTKTEPMYDNGWFVRATTQSELFNYADKTNYPYLFWEGKAYNFVTPNHGFVMSKDEVGVKMPKILAKLGLNEKETKDFLEFWQPKLEVKPYVFVTFLPQREFDKLAPLSVNPKPDTIIRVFMDYTPLDAPVKVAPMQIRTPERVGFTVVEWGGRLR